MRTLLHGTFDQRHSHISISKPENVFPAQREGGMEVSRPAATLQPSQAVDVLSSLAWAVIQTHHEEAGKKQNSDNHICRHTKSYLSNASSTKRQGSTQISPASIEIKQRNGGRNQANGPECLVPVCWTTVHFTHTSQSKRSGAFVLLVWDGAILDTYPSHSN